MNSSATPLILPRRNGKARLGEDYSGLEFILCSSVNSLNKLC